jgi:hypothetical protein
MKSVFDAIDFLEEEGYLVIKDNDKSIVDLVIERDLFSEITKGHSKNVIDLDSSDPLENIDGLSLGEAMEIEEKLKEIKIK